MDWIAWKIIVEISISFGRILIFTILPGLFGQCNGASLHRMENKWKLWCAQYGGIQEPVGVGCEWEEWENVMQQHRMGNGKHFNYFWSHARATRFRRTIRSIHEEWSHANDNFVPVASHNWDRTISSLHHGRTRRCSSNARASKHLK